MTLFSGETPFNKRDEPILKPITSIELFWICVCYKPLTVKATLPEPKRTIKSIIPQQPAVQLFEDCTTLKELRIAIVRSTPRSFLPSRTSTYTVRQKES